jgi:hypothetical protein
MVPPPGRGKWQVGAKRLAIAAVGLAPLALLSFLGREVPLIVGLLVPALVAAWILLGAPLAFRRFGCAPG